MSAIAAKKFIQDVFEETLTTVDWQSQTVKVLTLIEPDSDTNPIVILPGNTTEPGAEDWTRKKEVLTSPCVEITVRNWYSNTSISNPKMQGKFYQNGKWHEDTYTTVTKCGENGYVTYGTNAFGEFSMSLIRTDLIDQWHMSKSYTKRFFPEKRYMSTREYYKAKEKPEDLVITGGPSTRPKKRPRTFTGGVKGHTEWVRPEGSSP